MLRDHAVKRPRQGLALAALLLLAGVVEFAIKVRVALPAKPLPPPTLRPRITTPVAATEAGARSAAAASTRSADTSPIHFQTVQIVRKAWTPTPDFPNLTQALAELQPRAESGDTKAMIGIARAVDHCRLEPWPADDRGWIERYYAKIGVEPAEDDAEEVAEAAKAFKKYCTVPHQEVFRLYRDWLVRAADAGDSEAAMVIALQPPFDADFYQRVKAQAEAGVIESLDPIAGKPMALAEQYAKVARDHGEAGAPRLLAGFEAMKAPADQDRIELYTNASVANLLVGSGPRWQRWGKKFFSDLKARMRPIDIDTANARILSIMAAHPQWTRRPDFYHDTKEQPEGR